MCVCVCVCVCSKDSLSFYYYRTQHSDFWPRGYKSFFMLNLAEMKVVLLINFQLLIISNSFLLNICMNCKILFSGKNITNLSPAEIAQTVVKFKIPIN